MLDTNAKTLGLAAIAAIFLLVQVAKRLPAAASLNWAEGALKSTRADSPYSVKDVAGSGRTKPRLHVDPVAPTFGGIPAVAPKAPAAPVTSPTTEAAAPEIKVEDPEKAAKEARKKLAICDAANPKLDPRTGLPAPCKTRKVKDGQKVAGADAAISPANQASTADAANSGGSSSLGMDGGIGGRSAVVSAKKDAFDDSLEAWKKRLLGAPDPAETKVFVQRYQSGAVTADVFYEIAEEMVADPRDDMKQLGVMCAGVTPSAISFQILADLAGASPSSSAPHAAAAGYLANYSNLNYLGILSRVLAGSADATVEVEALQLLDQSAAHYQKVISQSTSPTSSAKLARYFQTFETLLTGLEKSTNSTIAYESKHDLSEIRALVSSAATATATASATATATATAAFSVASTRP